MVTLIIGNINHTNHHMVKSIAGDFGYMGCDRLVDECTRSIERVPGSFLDNRDFQTMIGRYAMEGFTVSIKHG